MKQIHISKAKGKTIAKIKQYYHEFVVIKYTDNSFSIITAKHGMECDPLIYTDYEYVIGDDNVYDGVMLSLRIITKKQLKEARTKNEELKRKYEFNRYLQLKEEFEGEQNGKVQ